MSYGIGLRHGLDLALLWPWRRLVATAPIQPLAWKPSYATSVALKSQKKKADLPLTNGDSRQPN